MDCEQVFVSLTAAPFPTGTPSDRLVEQHLASCQECRRFAQALLPCRAGAPESLTAREKRLLPTYRPVGALVPLGQAKGSGSGAQFPGLPSAGAAPYRPAMREQIAAFTHVPRPLHHPLADAFLLAALAAVAAACCWGVGMFLL